MSQYVLIRMRRKQNITGVSEPVSNGGPIHVKETVVTNSHGTTFIRRAFDRIGRKTGITQKAALNKSLKLMSDVYGDSVLKGGFTKLLKLSKEDLKQWCQQYNGGNKCLDLVKG